MTAQHLENLYSTLAEADTSRCPLLSGTLGYLKDFLGKPHPQLKEKGHRGSVCPFTPSVLREQTVYFGREAVNPADPQAAAKLKTTLVKFHMPHFLESVENKVSPEKRKLACLLIVVAGIQTPKDCNAYVTEVQKQIQPVFVKAGLLLSELHPHSTTPSARCPAFFPSRPPFPMFFIRRIIPNDIPYLLRRDRYNLITYRQILASLDRDFGRETIQTELSRLGKRLELGSRSCKK